MFNTSDFLSFQDDYSAQINSSYPHCNASENIPENTKHIAGMVLRHRGDGAWYETRVN